jgi:hypothetical protein
LSKVHRRAPIAVALAGATTVGGGAALPARLTAATPQPATAAGAVPLVAACPAGAFADGDACVALPADDEGAPAVESAVASHRDRRGDWVVYDQIPRRPDRPADYDAYRYPVACNVGCVFSGYDLDRDDAAQRRGRHLRHVGHGGVDLMQPRGTPVVATPLAHQQGDAEAIYAGPLFGTTVVTRHTVREGGLLRDYVVVLGHLEAPSPNLVGHPLPARVHEGDVLGFVGDTGSPGLVHLHLEVRRVREGVDAARLSPASLVDSGFTVVSDPRNVLAEK